MAEVEGHTIEAGSRRRTSGGRRPLLVVAVILLAGIFLSFGSARFEQGRVDRDREERLEHAADGYIEALRAELSRHAGAALALRDRIDQPLVVPRAEYDQAIAALDIDRHFPALTGINVVRRVPAGEVDQFLQLRREDDPGFAISSGGPLQSSGERWVISLVAPRIPNQPALGLDVASRTDLRPTLELARDGGHPVLTDAVPIVQAGPGVTGLILYVPAYGPGAPSATMEDRRRNIVGWIAVVFVGDQLLDGVPARPDGVELRISDHTPDGLVAVGTVGGIAPTARVTSQLEREVELLGQRWLVQISAGPEFSVRAEEILPWFVGIGGVLLTALVAVLGATVLRREARARATAQEATSELRHTNELLRDAVRERDDLIAVISHDIRSPLTVLRGLIHTVQSQWDTLAGPQRAPMIDMAMRNAEYIDELVESLLLGAQLGSGRLQAVPAHVRVADLADAVVQSITASPSSIAVDVPHELAVVADRRHVERILRNLLTNAMKYAAPPMAIRAREERHAVLIEVRDHGPGIPPALRPHLFQRFSRGDVAAASSGTGLGLAIVAELTNLNGGAAGHHDLEPHGSCFWIRLPKAPADDRPMSAMEGSSPRGHRR